MPFLVHEGMLRGGALLAVEVWPHLKAIVAGLWGQPVGPE